MEDIALTTASQTFFDKVLSLAQSEEDYSLIQSRLLFRSWAACDGNGDGVADQISLLENAAVGENGAVQMGAGGNLSIDIDGENSVICKIFVTCDQPECAALYDSASGSLMEPDDLDNGRAVFFVTLSGDGDTYTIQLSSTVDQTFSAVEILDGVT
jgi:hypothetical protein